MKQKFSTIFLLLLLLLAGSRVVAQNAPKPFDIEQPQHAPLPIPAQEGIREVKVVRYQKASEHSVLPPVNLLAREATGEK